MVLPSLRTLTTLLDPVRPPGTLRELVRLYRWPANEPPNPLSLRSLLERHNHPQAKSARLLWLNTELLRPIDLDLRALKAVFSAETSEQLKLPDQIHLAGVAVPERAKEVGQLIGKRGGNPYHVAALCEVYQSESVSSIKHEVVKMSTAQRVQAAEGPGKEAGPPLEFHLPSVDVKGSGLPQDERTIKLGSLPPVTSSGLLTVTVDRPIVRQEREAFRVRGHQPGADPDWLTVDQLANKGILLSEVDLGPGRVDLYSTHLYSGVIVATMKLGGAGSILKIQAQQARQVAEFIDRTHKRQNVAMLMGDFNMAECDDNFTDASRPYETLTSILRDFGRDRLQLLDLWSERVASARDCTCDADDTQAIGYTWTDDENHNAVCTPDGLYCDDFQTKPECTKGDKLHDNFRRIDYIFVEAPNAQHAFHLDFTRPRRRSLPRNPPTHGKNFISDHLGLEVTLLASPRL